MQGRSEYGNNSTNKRGIVVDRNPAKARIRVQFPDEDDMVSGWIDVLAKSTTGTQTFQMPSLGEEVWCAMDAKGEDGCLIGSKYNGQNAPPAGANEDILLIWGGGSIRLNTGSGNVNVTTDGTVKIVAVGIVLESSTLTHNGKDISDQHKHSGVTTGGGSTGAPN